MRYYVNTTDENGAPVRKQECVKLADKNDLYRSWSDVEILVENILKFVNKDVAVTAQISIADYIETHYLPWCRAGNKSARTANGYTRLEVPNWERRPR